MLLDSTRMVASDNCVLLYACGCLWDLSLHANSHAQSIPCGHQYAMKHTISNHLQKYGNECIVYVGAIFVFA